MADGRLRELRVAWLSSCNNDPFLIDEEPEARST